MDRLKGKVAVITGGNGGIGLATAQEFVSEGAKVVIFGRNPESLEAALATLGENAHAVQGDVASMADLDRLFAETHQTFGKIDVLFVNAGTARFTPIWAVTEAEFDLIVDTNFKGGYFTIQKALPVMNDNASIILTSSMVVHKGMATASVHTASKAALMSLARTLSADLAERGIRVNAISPGAIDTPMFGRLGMTEQDVATMSAQMKADIPVKRFGYPQEIAKAALFLASSDSSYMLGGEILVDGGISL